MQHRHRLLLGHLPGLDPRINRAAGTHIAKTVVEVTVELRETRLENKRVNETKEHKRAAEYFGANLTHLLNLVQVTDVQDLPPSVRPWLGTPNTNSSAFDGTAEKIGLRAPTIAPPSLLKLVLALGLRMESRDDLTTGLYPFVLRQHTSTVRKFLRGKAYQYAMVASGTGAP